MIIANEDEASAYLAENPDIPSSWVTHGIRVLRREDKYVIGLNVSSSSLSLEDPLLIDGGEELSKSFFQLIYLPTNEEHRKILASSKTKNEGPRSLYPGSAAVLFGSYWGDMRTIFLSSLQFSFIQGSPPELTRSLASRYMGATYRLLETLLTDRLTDYFDRVAAGPEFRSRHRTVLEKVYTVPRVRIQFEKDPGIDIFARRSTLR